MAQAGVDIIIAAHNEERYLGACLEALHRQDYPAELITITVVDSRSTDATARIAAAHGVSVLAETKPGAAAARNTGIRAGRGELVALLDGHCIPGPDWISRMAARFVDRRLGGLQSRIDNRASDPHVQRFMAQSGTLDNRHVIEDTVSGKRNIYPWILSGCSLYRRRAIEQAGLFDEALLACEDVDLAWRVLLLGYQLSYEPAAEVVHYDTNPWPRFIKKGLRYGRGAARLAQAYREHGARSKFVPGRFWRASKDQTLAGFYYWLGYSSQDLQQRLGLARPLALRKVAPVGAEFRPAFHWSGDFAMRIDHYTLYWFRDDDETTVIVHVLGKTRLVLDGVGDFIWRGLADGMSRAALVAALTARYNIAGATAASDLDEFVEELGASGVVTLLPQE